MPSTDLPVSILYVLIEQLQDVVFAIEAGKFIYVNERTSRLFGYPEPELLSRPITDFIHEDDRALVMERYAARLRGEAVPDEYEFRIVTQAGEVREVNMHVAVVTEAEGRAISVGSLRDVTEKHQALRELAHTQADIASILNNMPDVFYRTDMQGVITMMSPSAIDAIGYAPEEMIGRAMADFYCQPADRERVVQAISEGGGRAEQVEACMLHKDGQPIWVSTNAHIRFDDAGAPLCLEGIARNISDRKAMEEQLSRMARLDDLTQLLNRRQFLIEAEAQLAIAKRYDRPVVVVMVDIDHFKNINDRYGHEAGDKALIFFAQSCRKLFRNTDIVGRMGGEEFAVLMPESGEDAAMEVMQRLAIYLESRPLDLGDASVNLRFSAGLVSDAGGSSKTIGDLLREADRVLYRAKEGGRNQVLSAALSDSMV